MQAQCLPLDPGEVLSFELLGQEAQLAWFHQPLHNYRLGFGYNPPVCPQE